jgi:hypothetical protein
MDEEKSKHLALLAILAVAFAYRFLLLTMNTFPPGADIGLHESIIKSITSGKTNFFWNNYHMGGGLSVTNPGYHIFVAFVISMTGLPDYLAQALVASFFSAFIVLCAFLIVRQVWGELAGFIVAVLAVFSASDIVILSWAGYPNIITLMLIPIVFYLFLQRSKFSSKNYLAVTSLLISAIFLTHLFSGFVFIAIAALALFLAAVFWKKTGFTKKDALYWVVPIALGALLVSPYLVNVVPVYFGSQSAIIGSVAEMKQAVLETRLISLGIVGACVIPVFLFFVFSKFKFGKFFSVPSFLFAAWLLVPAVATQSYLLGVYLDYERFLYFLALPLIVCLGLAIASLPNAFAHLTERFNLKGRVKRNLNLSKKTATAILISGLVVIALFTPLFATQIVINQNGDWTTSGIVQANFFQVMNKPEYEAIQWINTNTPAGSVCVADAEFGWWLSGFAARPTLSAVDPQYLILEREFEPAKVASNLLKANYLIDNGLVQVKQEGAYASGNTHEISAISNTSYIARPFFSINDSQISAMYREQGAPDQFFLSQLSNSSTNVVSSFDRASFVVTRQSQLLNVTEEITIYRGVSYVKVSLILQSNSSNVNFDWLHLPFRSIGVPAQYPNTVVMVDNEIHQLSQIIFPDGELGSSVQFQENPDFYELVFSLGGKQTAEVSFFVGQSQFNPDYATIQADYWSSLIENNSKRYMDKIADLPLNFFDYKAAIREWNISYILVRNLDSVPRFAEDPTFTLVYKNSQVAIFQIVNP